MAKSVLVIQLRRNISLSEFRKQKLGGRLQQQRDDDNPFDITWKSYVLVAEDSGLDQRLGSPSDDAW